MDGLGRLVRMDELGRKVISIIININIMIPIIICYFIQRLPSFSGRKLCLVFITEPFVQSRK